MSYTKPGKRRTGDGGVAMLEPEQRSDDEDRCQAREKDEQARTTDDGNKRLVSDNAAGAESDAVRDGGDISIADMAARVARLLPQGCMPDMLADCIPGVDVIRVPGSEETGAASAGRSPGAIEAGDLVHTIWLRLCLILALGLSGSALAIADELMKMDAL